MKEEQPKYNVEIDPEDGTVESIEKTKKEKVKDALDAGASVIENACFLKLTRVFKENNELEISSSAATPAECCSLFDHALVRLLNDLNDKPSKDGDKKDPSKADYVG